MCSKLPRIKCSKLACKRDVSFFFWLEVEECWGPLFSSGEWVPSKYSYMLNFLISHRCILLFTFGESQHVMMLCQGWLIRSAVLSLYMYFPFFEFEMIYFSMKIDFRIFLTEGSHFTNHNHYHIAILLQHETRMYHITLAMATVEEVLAGSFALMCRNRTLNTHA